MSFSSEIKAELIKITDLPECCRHAMTYGMLLFGRSFNEQEISIMTDNPAVADKYTELSFDVTGVRAKRYVSEAGKTTVSFESAQDRKTVLDCFSNSGHCRYRRRETHLSGKQHYSSLCFPVYHILLRFRF